MRPHDVSAVLDRPPATVAALMSAAPDPSRRLLRSLTEQELLDVVAQGRAVRRGEPWRRAEEAWRLLAARNHDRLRGLVVAFSFPGHPGVRIPADEYDDATQECWIRAVKMLDNFRGTSLPQFRAALRTCVLNTCRDLCRRRMARERGIAGSLEEPRTAGEDEAARRFDAEVAERSSSLEAERAEAREDLRALGAALERIADPRRREVVRRRMIGLSSREVAGELGLSPANVDQLFSRGLKELGGLIDE